MRHTRLQPKTNACSALVRQGAVIPLICFFILILVAMAAFSIDVAYMELVRTQLRAATDAAAKAGTSSLMQGMTVSDAQTAAVNIAAANNVAGKPLKVSTSDIIVGQSVRQPDGTWNFVAGLQPYQAVQVTSRLTSSSPNGQVPLFFGPILGTRYYSTTNTSVASAFACEVCLVLDRSHSMCFDQTGTMWSYPLPYLLNWILGIENEPAPGSRWLALDDAVGSFCDILQLANAPPRVAVVTWASTIGTNTTEFQLTGQTSPAVTLDLNLTTNLDSVYNAVHNRSLNVMLGGTDMASGINSGISVLTSNNARPYAKKIMVLMTDGQWNTGDDPVNAAAVAAANNITIHCVCFLKNSDQVTTQQIAAMTGGQFYYASDSASLTAAFQKLAYSLPVVLTK